MDGVGPFRPPHGAARGLGDLGVAQGLRKEKLEVSGCRRKQAHTEGNRVERYTVICSPPVPPSGWGRHVGTSPSRSTSRYAAPHPFHTRSPPPVLPPLLCVSFPFKPSFPLGTVLSIASTSSCPYPDLCCVYFFAGCEARNLRIWGQGV